MYDSRKRGAADPLSTPDIVAMLLEAPDCWGDGEEEPIALNKIGVLHARGSQQEFDIAARLCQGTSSKERRLGADILSQLGWSDRTFLDESVDILLPMLNDADPQVVGAAGVALGHRNSSKAIAPALKLIWHPSDLVRWGTVFALSSHNDLDAVSGLIVLSRDADRDIKNWATFGLAQMTTLDTPSLRDALFERADDPDAEVRGEALIGLASRHDQRVLAPLERELSREFHGSWCLKAALELKAPSLHPLLVSLKQRMDPTNLAAFGKELDMAVAECLPR